MLTVARSGEVRLATWDEMDLDAGVWTIPAARMKAKRDHRVPLSGRALAILHDVRRRSDGTGLVFRSLRGKPLSNTTRWKLVKELSIAAVPHGHRRRPRDEGLAGVVRAVRAGAAAARRADRDLVAAGRTVERASDALGPGLQDARRDVARTLDLKRQRVRERDHGPSR